MGQKYFFASWRALTFLALSLGERAPSWQPSALIAGISRERFAVQREVPLASSVLSWCARRRRGRLHKLALPRTPEKQIPGRGMCRIGAVTSRMKPRPEERYPSPYGFAATRWARGFKK